MVWLAGYLRAQRSGSSRPRRNYRLYPAALSSASMTRFFCLRGDQRRWPGTVWLTLGICAIPLADRLEAR